MAQLKVPEQPRVQTIAYENLLGVDYQTDQTEISRRHSPDMVNMISDLGGNPVKRYGYRDVGSDAVFDVITEVGGVTYGINKSGNSISVYSVTFDSDGKASRTLELTSTSSDLSNYGDFLGAETLGGKVYLFYEDLWFSFDPTSEQDGSRIAGESAVGIRNPLFHEVTLSSEPHICATYPHNDSIIPTVYTMYKPDGSSMVSLPAGTDITGATQGVNLLTPYRRIEYCVQADTADEKGFNLPQGQVAGGDAKVEILDAYSLEWVEVNNVVCTRSSLSRAGTAVIADSIGYTIEPSIPWLHTIYPWVSAYKFCFPPNATAPYIAVNGQLYFRKSDGTASDIPVPAGIPNVRITYPSYDTTLVDREDGIGVISGLHNERRYNILKSSARIIYDGRLWVADGNRVYYSRANEPFNIDDNYYIEVDSPVKSLAKTSGGLAIIGEGSAPVYIASGSFNEAYNAPVYSVKASNANIEALNSSNQIIFNDEPIVLTRDGIYGLQSNYYSDKYSIMRSGKINRRLCAESGLASAAMVVYKNYLWVAVGNHMYVLDGRHKDSSRNGDNSYECYFFDGMPAIKEMWVLDGRMLFSDGTTTYTWNDDLEEKLQYRDHLEWDSEDERWVNGVPVKAKWTSLLDGDNAPHYYKTLQKKGTMVTVSPPMQTSCQITLVRDAHDSIYVGRFNGSTFALTSAVLDAFTKKKVKKYKRLQFVIENNEAEPFGIISVVKSYILNNYAKR